MQAIATTPPTETEPASATPRHRFWFRGAAALGAVWNAYGVYQFAASFGATPDTLMAGGLSRPQAELYLGLPAWMSVVFAIGVLGGLFGSLALAARRQAALVLFGASLAGYTLLFAGDAWFGLFAAMPGQLAVLSVVMLIAIGLLATAVWARRVGWLR